MSKFILNWIVHLCFKNNADGIKIYTSNMCIIPFTWDLQNLITQWCQRPVWNSSQTLTHRICSCIYVNLDGIILWIGPSNSFFTKWNSSDQDTLDSVNVYVSNYHNYMCRVLCFWYFRIIAQWNVPFIHTEHLGTAEQNSLLLLSWWELNTRHNKTAVKEGLWEKLIP